MTKSKNVGRGGARPGAGRRRGPSKKTLQRLAERAERLKAVRIPRDPKRAADLLPLALFSLRDICERGVSDMARVRAAAALLNWTDDERRRAK